MSDQNGVHQVVVGFNALWMVLACTFLIYAYAEHQPRHWDPEAWARESEWHLWNSPAAQVTFWNSTSFVSAGTSTGYVVNCYPSAITTTIGTWPAPAEGPPPLNETQGLQ